MRNMYLRLLSGRKKKDLPLNRTMEHCSMRNHSCQGWNGVRGMTEGKAIATSPDGGYLTNEFPGILRLIPPPPTSHYFTRFNVTKVMLKVKQYFNSAKWGYTVYLHSLVRYIGIHMYLYCVYLVFGKQSREPGSGAKSVWHTCSACELTGMRNS